ncbi:MAG: RNA-binding S4 domain-containing protein [Jatrophihabitans sp.]
MREVVVKDGTIRLGQFLKLADFIESGSDAKAILAQDIVTVNGRPEVRRGKQLQRGDVIGVADTKVRVG